MAKQAQLDSTTAHVGDDVYANLFYRTEKAGDLFLSVITTDHPLADEAVTKCLLPSMLLGKSRHAAKKTCLSATGMVRDILENMLDDKPTYTCYLVNIKSNVRVPFLFGRFRYSDEISADVMNAIKLRSDLLANYRVMMGKNKDENRLTPLAPLSAEQQTELDTFVRMAAIKTLSPAKV